jgi:hypothetical protein
MLVVLVMALLVAGVLWLWCCGADAGAPLAPPSN